MPEGGLKYNIKKQRKRPLSMFQCLPQADGEENKTDK